MRYHISLHQIDRVMLTDLDVTIVIPQRNPGNLTRNCIESLRTRGGFSGPVIIVDDGSDADCDAWNILPTSGDTRIISQPARGVTAAWNTGLREVSTPWVVLLNNDVLIQGPFLESLLQPLREQRASITGPESRRERDLPNYGTTDFSETWFLAGWCLAFHRELRIQLDGFDESMCWYFSDTDFQLRTAKQSPADETSTPLLVIPGLPLLHLGHRTACRDPRRRAIWEHDRAVFQRKWG